MKLTQKRVNQMRKWDKANPGKRRAYSKRWRDANLERHRAKNRLWALSHPTAIRDAMREARRRNPNYDREQRARSKLRRAWHKWASQCARTRAA